MAVQRGKSQRDCRVRGKWRKDTADREDLLDELDLTKASSNERQQFRFCRAKNEIDLPDNSAEARQELERRGLFATGQKNEAVNVLQIPRRKQSGADEPIERNRRAQSLVKSSENGAWNISLDNENQQLDSSFASMTESRKRRNIGKRWVHHAKLRGRRSTPSGRLFTRRLIERPSTGGGMRVTSCKLLRNSMKARVFEMTTSIGGLPTIKSRRIPRSDSDCGNALQPLLRVIV